MGKSPVPALIRSFLLLLTGMFFLLPQLRAQTDYTVGTGSAGNAADTYPCPLGDFHEGTRSQYLFLASELQAAGLTRGYLTGLKFNILNLNSAGPLENFSIKIGTTTKTSLGATTWESVTTQVFAPNFHVPVAGVNAFPFTTNFMWNGTDNIIIELCKNGGSFFFFNQSSNPTIAWTTDLGFNASRTYGVNDVTNLCTNASTEQLGTATTRPNFTFSWKPECSGTPVAGNAVTTRSAPCSNESFTLSLEGASTDLGITYQWQSSPNNVTWTDIANAKSATYTAMQSTTTYYRAVLTCSNGGGTATSGSVMLTAPVPVSGTFTIDNSVASSGGGVFKTFTEAFNYIKCGINAPVVFNVVNTGTPYNEQVIVGDIVGTSAANTITINGNGAALLYTSTNIAEYAVLKLNGTDFVTIDNLVVTAGASLTGEYGFGIQLMNDADNNTVKNCTININPESTAWEYAGIVVSASASNATSTGNTKCDNNVFDHNTINGGQYGITLLGSNSVAVQNNRITNNTIKNFYQYGIYIAGSNGTIVEGNDLTRPNRVSSSPITQGRSLQVIYVNQVNVNMRITRNKIHALKDGEPNSFNDTYGIAIVNSDADVNTENIISNNLIYDIKGHGDIYGIYNFGSNGTFFFHNTISLDQESSKAAGITAGIYFTSTVNWAQVMNNQVSIKRGGTGFRYGTYLATTPGLYTSDYNNFFLPPNPLNYMGFMNNTQYRTLAEWTTASTQEAHSFNTDPGFVAADQFDFKPSSAIINDKGTPVNVLTDFNNASRSTTVPDMGAYEYSLAACLTNSNPGQAYSSLGTSACPDKPIVLNLKGADLGLGLTYQWQSATSEAGPWTNISDPLQYPVFYTNTGASTIYYRAAVSCNGGTPNYSAVAKVEIGVAFPAGTYTIDNTAPTDPAGTKNFNSFNDAVKAISCGIAGPIVFKVKDGVYTEQVRIANIPGTSPVNTVTFISESNTASKVELKYATTDMMYNYVLQLDSARYINFRAITFSTPNAELGRVIEYASTAAYDTLENCIINAPQATTEANSNVGIYAAAKFRGGFLYVKNNTINGGAKGVFISGNSFTELTEGNTIIGNTFRGTFHEAITFINGTNTNISGNDIDLNTPFVGAGFNVGVKGISISNSTAVSHITNNKITAHNGLGSFYAIFLNNVKSNPDGRSNISGNRIVAQDNMAGTTLGIYIADIQYMNVRNNTVAVKSSKVDPTFLVSAALQFKNSKHTDFYNNSLLNTSLGTSLNVGAYFDNQYYTGGGNTNFKNNLVMNKGDGAAIFVNYTMDFIKSDYNLLYAAGAAVVQRGPTHLYKLYPNLPEWRKEYSADLNSITYVPALKDDESLEPDAANPGSWAMQGHGVQLAGNDKDINGNTRSVTLTDGVPDIGAYEFHPSVEPPVLTGVPAVPVAGETQHFMMGTDTVAKIMWTPGASVPTAVTMKRYSGMIPDGLAATEKSLYSYTSIDATGSGTFNYELKHYYLGSWLRNLGAESYLKHGRTDATNKWAAGATSTVDSLSNFITESGLDHLGKFSGMTDGKKPDRPVFTTTPDSSNLGTRFWLPYEYMRDMKSGNGQQLKMYLSATKATQVTVKVNGTAYSKTYSVPANGIVLTDEVPKTGVNDARIIDEGFSDRGVLVESQEPIGVHAYVFGGITNAMILPTGTYGYEYTALNFRQHSGYPEYGLSTLNVIADNDNTVIEITPSVPTAGGKAAGVPFRVALNRGEVYQVLGAYKAKYPHSVGTAYEGYDLSGTTVVSVPNDNGKCQPIAVFSGSAGTSVRCDPNEHREGGEAILYQQNFPDQAMGKHYLTAPLSTTNGVKEPIFHIYRVLVKDPNTKVKRNGVELTDKTGSWYEFTSNTPDYIEADRPVMVAQYNPYFTSCGNDYYFTAGIQEGMTYLSPLGHGIKKSNFYRVRPTGEIYPFHQYLTLVVPNEGLTSLKVDGANTFDSVYAHPNRAGYSVVVKRWRAGNANGVVECDTTFTGLASLAGNGAYFYNIGMQIPRPKFDTSSIHNVYNISGRENTYTCVGTPFKPSVRLSVMPKSLTWKLSAVPGMQPTSDVTESNLVAVDTVEINFKDYYVFTLNTEIKIANTGEYDIPVTATYATTSSSSSCENTFEGVAHVTVIDAPVVDITKDYNGCVTSEATFTASGTASMPGETIDRWKWNFGDNSTSEDHVATHKFSKAGEFKVTLEGIATDGCVGSKEQNVTVYATPLAQLEKDSIGICPDGTANFVVKDPKAGVIYNWYDAENGGTNLGTGTSYQAENVSGKAYIYVDATENGCGTESRTKAVVYIIPNVPAPVATTDVVGYYSASFKWAAVPGASGYEVSINNGATWSTPSSGSTGLTHTLNGLASKQEVTLLVRSKGGCTDNVSEPVTATTLDDKIFIPNTFTPNGDGKNDVLKVYAQGVKEITMMIFNQWGEKIFESNNVATGWNGMANGKAQPTGVYMYVCRIVTIDNKVVVKKGSVNLIR